MKTKVKQIKTTIIITEDQRNAIRQIAYYQAKSMAEIIRQAIDGYIKALISQAVEENINIKDLVGG